jgi:hypothetical protein
MARSKGSSTSALLAISHFSHHTVTPHITLYPFQSFSCRATCVASKDLIASSPRRACDAPVPTCQLVGLAICLLACSLVLAVFLCLSLRHEGTQRSSYSVPAVGDAVWCGVVRCGAVWCGVVRCCAVRRSLQRTLQPNPVRSRPLLEHSKVGTTSNQCDVSTPADPPCPFPRQKGLKNVFDEAIRAVLAPPDRGVGQAKKKKKQCVVL